MNKSYLNKTVLLCALALLGITPLNSAIADEFLDPGIPDTVTVISAQVSPGDHFPLTIRLWNDEEIGAATLGFAWGTSDLFLDSISFLGTRTASADLPQSAIDNSAHLGLAGFATFFGPPMPAGEGKFAIFWFTVDANAADQEIIIDSSFVPPAGPFILIAQSDNSAINPQFVVGTVTIGNPNSNTPPTIASISNQSVSEGDTLTVAISAVDAESTPSLSVTGLAPFMSFDGQGAASGTLSATPGFSDAGVYPITVIASDGELADTLIFQLTVNNVNRPPMFAPLSSVAIDVGDTLIAPISAVDQDDDSLTLELTNPLASNTTFTDKGDGTGIFIFAPSAAQGGSTYVFIFGASDQDTSVTEDFEVTVNPAEVLNDSAFISPDTLWFSAPEGADVILSDCAWLSSTNARAEYSASVESRPEPTFTSVEDSTGVTNDSVCVLVNPSGLSAGEYYNSVVYNINFVSNNPVELVVCLNIRAPISTVIQLDIKPGSCPNSLNTKGRNAQHRAVLPVAIVGANDFDVRDIDVASLRLEGVSPVRWSYEDVSEPIDIFSECDCQETSPDSIEDLTLKSYRSELIDALGSLVGIDEMSLTITGKLNDGTDFSASDCIETRPKDKDGNGSTSIPIGADGPPGVMTLVGNYPNPFNPSTKITYGIPKSEHVTISIYNVQGQKIATLVDGVKEAGYHDVEWDASNLASGMYFYRLQSTSFSQTRKMILLK